MVLNLILMAVLMVVGGVIFILGAQRIERARKNLVSIPLIITGLSLVFYGLLSMASLLSQLSHPKPTNIPSVLVNYTGEKAVELVKGNASSLMVSSNSKIYEIKNLPKIKLASPDCILSVYKISYSNRGKKGLFGDELEYHIGAVIDGKDIDFIIDEDLNGGKLDFTYFVSGKDEVDLGKYGENLPELLRNAALQSLEPRVVK
jgi:hypothetical protein